MIARFAISILLLAFVPLLNSSAAEAASKPAGGKAEHLVLVIFDGMRPDFVSEKTTPHLWKLARRGVLFRNHHSIYPTLTNVNAAALATGRNPNGSGVIANWIFRPELGTAKLVSTDAPEIIRKIDELSGGKYLAGSTVAELVRAGGGRTAIAGTKTAALLHDRKERADAKSATLFSGETVPADKIRELVAQLGEFPAKRASPNVAQDAWTTRALTEVLWKDGVPEYSVLWLSDPDRSQHSTSPGTDVALAGISSADENLGRIVHALEEKKALAKTNILVASDHGFSTIARAIDVAGFLRERGFDVADENDLQLARGQVRIAGNGGTNLYYVGERDAETTKRLVETLQQTDFAAVIFSREPVEGVFRLSDARLDTEAGPDVVMSFRGNGDRNSNGVAGMIAVNGSSGKDKGTHGTLSPFDVHNTFIAAGPDFRNGMESDLPTANTDVAATIMHLLGLKPGLPVDGRVVTEALLDGAAPKGGAVSDTLEAVRNSAAGTWRQRLRLSRVGDHVYLDEGAGEFTPQAAE